MSNLNGKRIFCMLLAVAVLSSGMELPANAAEQTEEVPVEETQEETETVLEETQEETETAFKETQTETELVSEEIQEQTETDCAEETILVEEQENAASYSYPTGGFNPQQPDFNTYILPGGGTWKFDSATGTLTVNGKGEFHSSNTTAVPWAEYQDQIKTAVISLTGTKNFSDLLYNCKNLTSVDLSKTDTSNAVNMNGMFMNCNSLEKLDISGFNTSKVTNMRYMFRGCSSLKQLTFGTNFKTNNVTDMEMMFTGVGLESLDLSGFDMAKVKNADNMISSDRILEMNAPRNLKISVPFRAGTWIKDDGTVIRELPQNQSTSIHVKQKPKLDARKTKKIYDVGEKLDLSDLTVELIYNDDQPGFNRREIKDYTTNAASINMSTTGTKDLIISYQGQSVTIQLTVRKRTLLVTKKKTAYYLGESLNVDDLDVHIQYQDGSVYYVKDYTTNKDSINMNTVGTKDLIVKYEGVSATVKITVEERSFTYSNLQVKNAKPTYYANEKFDRSELTVTVNRKNSIRNETVTVTDYTTNVDKLGMSTPGTKTLTISYQGLTASTQITVEPPVTWEVLPGFGTFRHVYEVGEKPDFNNMQIVFCYSTGGTFGTTGYETNINQIDMSTPGKKTLHITYEFANMTMETDTDIFVIDKFRDDDIKHGKRNTLAYRLDKDGNLTIAGIENCQFSSSDQLWWKDGCDPDSVKTVKMIMSNAYGTYSMFEDCSNLESADLSELGTNESTFLSTSLRELFRRCYKLKSVNLNGLDTSYISDMKSMFEDCKSLKSLDLSGFDASNVTDAYNMLSGCSALTSLRTPRNLNLDSMPKLPAKENEYWHDQNGKIYTCLPKGLSTSILLTKDTIPEEESSAVPESSKVPESSSAKESSKVEESSSTKESSKVEESSSVIESSKVEESSETQENPPSEEHSKVEESSASKESSKTEESSKVEESSSVIESSKVEESSDGNESTSENESSKTDLNAVGGTLSPVKAKVYDQNAYEPSVKVTVVQNRKKITLTEGVDYQVTYQNNVDAGTGTVLVKGNGNYKGTLKTTFTINPKSIKKLKLVTGSMATGSTSEPPVYVYDGTTLLREGTDYKLDYDANLIAKAAKSAKITVTGQNNYKDSKAVKVTVYDADTDHIINPEHITLKQQNIEYTGKALQPVPVVKIGSTTLTEKKDYKVRYQNNINAGTAYVIVTGKGAYQGEVVKTFEITALKASKTKLTITKIPDQTYNGQLQKPSVTVKAGTKKLTKNKDYTVTYTGNLHASTDKQKAKVIITGKGNYAGITATASFTILPQKISKASVKGTQKSLTVSYGKTQLKENIHYKIIPDTASAKKDKIKVIITGLGDFAGSEVTKTIKVQ